MTDQWLQAALFWLAVCNLVVVLVCLSLLTLGRYLVRRLNKVPLEELPRWPRVSLIAPARNEERHIEAAVRSLTRLFEYAKFSGHAIDAGMKEEAIAALVSVRDDLRRDEAVAA